MSSKKLFKDKAFAERLKTFIDNQLNISRSEFCNIVGISEGYLSMIISGRRGPSAELIAGLHIHYSKYLTWILTGENREVQSSHSSAKPIDESLISSAPKKKDILEKLRQLEARMILVERILSESKPNPGRRFYDTLVAEKK